MAILCVVMRHQQEILLIMIEEAIMSGQCHISSEAVAFFSKPLWTASAKLRAYCFSSTVSQDQATDAIREFNRSCEKGEEVNFGDSFHELC